ncbi:MAG: NifU family protein [Candidatus Omnitrophica bacterium]|nr:NifU family protein [Candidatus Omnitrophota bacterium]
MREKVEKALDKLRPYLQADGGDVEIVEITGEGILKLKLTGTCGCCPMSQMPLRDSVEKIIREEVPGINQILLL